MPQADIYHTVDISLPAREILAQIETVVKDHDSGAGQCKGRTHSISEFHHSHIYLTLSLLPKPHRDAAYAADLGGKLGALLQPHLPAGTTAAVNIRFDLAHYTSVKAD